MFTRDSKVLSNKLTTPLTEVSKVIGNVFKKYVEFDVLIKPIFANNEQGFAYDPNDLTTMFQDAAGTVPVTAAGQPVGLVKDKSGRNNHAYQTTSASRPLLQRNATTGAYYLAFDGSDDFLVTSSINFTATDKISLFVGVRKLTDVGVGILVELSSSLNANNNSFYISKPTYRFASKGTLPIYGTLTTALGYAAPVSFVISAKGSISQDYSEIRVDSVQKATTTVDQGTGNYGNYPIYIGRRGGTSLPFNGHIYSLIGIGRLTTDAETVALEKLIAKNTGVTLSV